ncbi:membrane protein DedA with SNARE-associated domain [Litorimonas taeanensis]|uniref:Membrane protein DedA with SNARE-associated domain n=1 Tax=Litorimonas taeanensis TaxID=568099 RepID=A0A420WJL6_9PROT|nr:VTT domain-containing protein [Litorimonas taeanensis]RKQ71116.1 membrane protein DedA with SNARE-associated domain [Litorimonas taeanensis]
MDPNWLLYLGIALGPFVQEDAAVITAATLSASNPAHFPNVFIVILIGLFFSDIWKYWIGWAALKHKRARSFAEKKHVADLQEKVQKHLFFTLLGARFLPLARIPAYVACGYFKVSYPKFCGIIAITAFLYALVIFGICHYLGEMVGDQIEFMLPLIAIGLIIFFGSIFWWKARRERQLSTAAQPPVNAAPLESESEATRESEA